MRIDIEREGSGSTQTQSGGEHASGSGGHDASGHIQLLSEVDADMEILKRQKMIKIAVASAIAYFVFF